MRQVTRYDLGMMSGNLYYILPFTYDANVTDADYLGRLVRLFDEYPNSSPTRIEPHGVIKSSEKHMSVELSYLFQGYDEYYPFHIRVELLRDESSADMYIAGHYEHAYGGLLDELLQDKVLPQWAKRLRLQEVF